MKYIYQNNTIEELKGAFQKETQETLQPIAEGAEAAAAVPGQAVDTAVNKVTAGVSGAVRTIKDTVSSAVGGVTDVANVAKKAA